MTRSLELLDRLIAFPTVSHTSNLDLIDWAQNLLQRAGCAVTRIPSADGQKAGLHARIGPTVAGGICLSGHTDVVPTEGQKWTHDPFRMTQQQDRVLGRGATDMKGFVASALAAAERADSARLTKPLSLVLSYDEEVGCVGIHDMLPQLTPLLGAPDLVIVGEPTAMQVAIGHKGKAALTVTCAGEAGHSALAPQFVNAIHVAGRFISEVEALQKRLSQMERDLAYDVPYTTVHIGKINGGRALNIVPDTAMLEMEYRHLAKMPSQQVLKYINDAAARVAAASGPAGSVTVKTVNAYPGLDQAADTVVTDLACGLSAGAGITKVAFGTEAGYFAGLGLDTVVIGPGDMATDGHKPDEALTLDQLNACDAMMDRVLTHLC